MHRWLRRYAAHFTAVGIRAVLYTTARVDAALFSCGWYGRCLAGIAATVDTALLLQLL